MDRNHIGATIRRYREAAGLSQEAAARAAGVSLNTWGRWERGEIVLNVDRLRQVAGLLGTEAAELLAEKGE